jgi:MFS family permease
MNNQDSFVQDERDVVAEVSPVIEDLRRRSKEMVEPPGGFQAWLICLVAPLFCFYEFVQLMMFNAIDPSLMQDFHVKATELGKISAAYLIATLIFMFPAGMLLDRFSTRKIILTAMSLCVCGTILFSFSQSVHMAMLGRFITGIGGSFPLLCCLRLASRWFPPKRLALVSGLAVTIMMLGGVVGQTPMTFLTEILGWRNALRIDALVGASVIILMYFTIVDFPSKAMENTFKQEAGLRPNLKKSILQIIGRIPNWLFGIYTCLLNLPVMLLGAVWGSLFLVQVHHFTAMQASYVTSMIFFGTIVGAPTVGLISDAMKRRKLPMMLFGVVSVLTVLTIMYTPAANLTEMLVLFFVLGFVTSSQVLTYPAIVESNPHHQTGAALGFASVIILGPISFFQPFFGWLMDLGWKGQIINGVAQYSAKDYHAGFLIFPIAFMVGMLAIIGVRETYKHHKKSLLER